MFRKLLSSTILAISVTGLAACGTTDEERAITGAGLGGATGVFTERDDLNLGEPIWKWD